MTVLLHLAIALPLIGCLALAAMPAAMGGQLARTVGLVASALTLLVVLAVAAVFDRDDAGQVQLLTDVEWAPTLGLSWRIGVDGLSLPFVVLTALLVFCCLLYTVRIRPAGGRLRAFVALV